MWRVCMEWKRTPAEIGAIPWDDLLDIHDLLDFERKLQGGK